MGLSSNLSASVITHLDQQQNKKYSTAQTYILDKFRCAVEFGRGLHIMSVGKDRKFDYPFNWGIRLGYYLYKYHHVSAKPGDFKPYYAYNSFTKQRELIEPRGGISREGEGSILDV
ncbi:MAG: hypothetical protein BGO68_01120 [Candidatus Amoebophilus sp. 36-38]|nr:MAG: hypothetical protein BGO68_01120 [Candidatus Amoebophilus sp. 36-38]